MSESRRIFLEFGSIDIEEKSRNVYDLRTGPQAYEWFMLARYLADLHAYVDLRQMTANLDEVDLAKAYKRGVHHKNDCSLQLDKLIALSVAGRSQSTLRFFELGSTVFGCIEGMQFVRSLLLNLRCREPFPDLRHVHWYGVDISSLFNMLALKLHGEMRIETAVSLEELTVQSFDLFFSKGVTLLYALRSVEELLNHVGRSRVSLFDYSFSLGESQDTVIGTGKDVRYLSLPKYIDASSRTTASHFVRKDTVRLDTDTNRVFVEMLVCDSETKEAFVDASVRARQSVVTGLGGQVASELLGGRTGSTETWSELADIAKQIGI